MGALHVVIIQQILKRRAEKKRQNDAENLAKLLAQAVSEFGLKFPTIHRRVEGPEA